MLLSSSVGQRIFPGSMKPAVACTIIPSRPSELLPLSCPTTPAEKPIFSCVTPSTNSPGCNTNTSQFQIERGRLDLLKIKRLNGDRPVFDGCVNVAVGENHT